MRDCPGHKGDIWDILKQSRKSKEYYVNYIIIILIGQLYLSIISTRLNKINNIIIYIIVQYNCLYLIKSNKL